MKKLIAIIFVLSLFSTGCKKLDRIPYTTGDGNNFFKDATGLQQAVNGMYDVFQGDIWGGGLIHLMPHSDALSEDATLAFPGEGQWGEYAFGRVTPGLGGLVYTKWTHGYRGITRANVVLANVDDPAINITDQQRKQYKAEARFIRGFIYSILITHYGDVPLLLEPVSIENSKLSRTAKAEVLKQVLEDYDFAAQNLGAVPPNNEWGRATKQAALALKARILMYNKRLSEAIEVLKQVMEMEASGVVRLTPDYESLFNGYGNNDPESIFALQSLGQTETRPDVGEGSYLCTFYGMDNVARGIGWGSISYQETMFDAYYMKDGLPVTSSPLYNPAKPYANRDPRLSWSFFIEGISTWMGQPYIAKNNYSGDIPEFPLNTKKWVSDKDVWQRASNVNYIIIRYADILLMYAEAQNEIAGPDASVYAAVNKVRARAQMPAFPGGLTKDQMREEIRHERKVEFCQEGLRFFDLMRWGIAVERINANKRSQRNFKDHMLLLPVPQNEMDVNPNLKQNPGYL